MVKNRILLSLMCVFTLGILTGCNDKSTQDDVENYLKEYYPNESFQIVSQEHIDNIKSSNYCGSDITGHKYTVMSNETNIQFIVEDEKESTSYGTCRYILTDNYHIVALEKYIVDFNDSRITLDTRVLDSDIKVDYKDFQSTDEMAEVLYNFKMYYESKKPFMDKPSVEVFVEDTGNSLGYMYLSYNNREITLDSIHEKILEILEQTKN